MTTNKKQNKCYITEISEEDFRKLNLFAYKHTQNGFEKVDLNKELDENIKYLLEQGYESDLEDLKCPVTIAIHKENHENPRDYYLDKWMNCFSCPGTYEIGFGIRHLYYSDFTRLFGLCSRFHPALHRDSGGGVRRKRQLRQSGDDQQLFHPCLGLRHTRPASRFDLRRFVGFV